jgi:iron(III) transport system ATP-binding protein
MTDLTVTDLHAAHGRSPILNGVDLTVAHGQLACVLGPSGCGKSTLLRVIAGFHPASRGQLTLDGRVLDDATRRPVSAERRRIGYVPQDGALFPHLTVAANIGFGLPRRERRKRVSELLDLIGLPDLAERHPHQLSGGQQQRVALARALAPQPELLLLDEPFSALDTALRATLRTDVAVLLRSTGTTAVLVTHDQEEALAIADTVAVMQGGRITQQATPHRLYHQPTDADTARLLGEANLLPARLDTTVAHTALGPLPLSGSAGPATDATVLLRPHQLRLSTTDGPDRVRVRVVRSVFRGADHRVELVLEAGAQPLQPLVAHTDTAPPSDGQPLYLTVTGHAHPV